MIDKNGVMTNYLIGVASISSNGVCYVHLYTCVFCCFLPISPLRYVWFANRPVSSKIKVWHSYLRIKNHHFLSLLRKSLH